MSETPVSPNATLGAVTEHTSVNPLDNTIAGKMAAMLAARDAQRNLNPQSQSTETGSSSPADEDAPEATDNVDSIVEPEDSYAENDVDNATAESVAPDEVSTDKADSSADELIDFIEFTESNPKAKFKFTRNGKEIIIDAKKAAAILGQGSAIHEDARELKVQKAEFEEYLQQKRAEAEGLTLAMEFTIQPKLKKAFDEIVRVQGYQTVFQQQLANARDAAEQARIQAAMDQNTQYLQQQSRIVNSLKPRIDEFRQQRQQQVNTILETNRQAFKDKELKNKFVYNELRERVSKGWDSATGELVPGVKNIDLIASDEHILSLLRDGLKYRDKPRANQAGASLAAVTGKTRSPTTTVGRRDEIATLREQANKGDRKAAQNLLEARMAQIRANRR